MKIKILLLCMLALLLFGGCASPKGDFFAPFRGEFTAKLEGEWNSLVFEGELTATAPDESGAREMTLTFYAPSTLSGTVLKRDTEGAISLSADGLSLPLTPAAAQGYGALFALFPTEGEVRSVTQENGNTRLDGADFSLVFAPDGTPLAASNAVASVQVRAWR